MHCILDEMKSLVLTLPTRFLKSDLLNGITSADMCKIALDEEENYLPLKAMDIGENAKLKVI